MEKKDREMTVAAASSYWVERLSVISQGMLAECAGVVWDRDDIGRARCRQDYVDFPGRNLLAGNVCPRIELAPRFPYCDC